MATIICRQCGFENEEGSTVCEMCYEPLGGAPSPAAPAPIPAPAAPVNTAYAQQPSPTPAPAAAAYHSPTQPMAPAADSGTEYYVDCPESNTRTIVESGDIRSFYCQGCRQEHEIDGFIWAVNSRQKNDSPAAGCSSAPNTGTAAAPAQPSGNLVLEEVFSHYTITIDRSGGTLGRYGKYGSEFFLSRAMHTVSGEHCLITFEFGSWVLRHMSRTNSTRYDNMLIGADEPVLLENGKMLTLAETVSFIVRIE